MVGHKRTEERHCKYTESLRQTFNCTGDVGCQLAAGNNSSCSLCQPVGVSYSKHLEIYGHILSGCYTNFTL